MAKCQNVIPAPSKIARLEPRRRLAGKNRFSSGFWESNCKQECGLGLPRARRKGAICPLPMPGSQAKRRFRVTIRHSRFDGGETSNRGKRQPAAGSDSAFSRLFRKSAEIRIATTRQKKCFVTSSGNFSRHKIGSFWLTYVKDEADLQKYVLETSRIPLYPELFESSAG